MSTAKDFLEKFADIHPLPHVVTTVTRLINDPESTMKDYEEVIKMDPILVSRLLRLVNSAYFGLVQKVDSIGRAVAFLGMKNLRNLVIADSLKNIFVGIGTDSVFSKARLWDHCAAVSICNKMVAERIFGINGDDAFLCGILHDYGLLVEEQIHPKEFGKICNSCSSTDSLIEMEHEAFSTDHSEICYTMTLDWDLPESIQEAIRDHHRIFDDIEPSSLTGIIQISEYLTSQLGHTKLPELDIQISPKLIDHMQENLDEYSVLIDDLPEEIASSQSIYG